MEKVRLGDICNIKSGGTPSRQRNEFYNGSIPWAKISDLETSGDSFVNSTAELITAIGLDSINNKIFQAGTLFFAMYGSVGKTAFAGKKMSCNQAILGINPKTDDKVDLIFLNYWFKANKEKLLDGARGVALKNLSATIVKDLKIPLPPLKTQQKIAAILDEADKLRQLDKKLIKQYEALSQSLFLEMFGDPVKNNKTWKTDKLGSICGVGSSKRVFVKELVDEGIPFYRGKEIGKLSTGKSIGAELFITEKHYEKLKEDSGIPKIGDLLMPSICPDGRIFRVSDSEPFYFKDGRVLWIKVNNIKLNSFYLQACLKGIFKTDYLNIASGTTFAELKIFALKKINLPIPPVQLQNLFEERINSIEIQKSMVKKQNKKSEALFNSLLQKAFKGELV